MSDPSNPYRAFSHVPIVRERNCTDQGSHDAQRRHDTTPARVALSTQSQIPCLDGVERASIDQGATSEAKSEGRQEDQIACQQFRCFGKLSLRMRLK